MMLNRTIFSILVILLSIAQLSQQNIEIENKQSQIDRHQLNSSEIMTQINTQNIQIEAKRDQQHQIEVLDEWLKDEMHHNSQDIIPDTFDGQSFIFKIEKLTHRKFIIPSNGTSSLDLLVRVFELKDKQILVPKNPAKDYKIIFKVLGKQYLENSIYLVRKIRIQYKQKQYQIMIQNKYPTTMIIEIRLQKQSSSLITSIDSSKIDPFVTKMNFVLEQMQAGISQKRLIFKSQLGQLQQQEKQHASMLVLTAIELITLITSVSIQMYYLKKMISSKSLI